MFTPIASMLDLDSISLIISTIVCSDMFSNFSKVGLASGMYSVGNLCIGSTDSATFLPAMVKKLLNSSAILLGSQIVSPFTTIFSILFCSVFPVVISLRISHVFFGFLAFALILVKICVALLALTILLYMFL